MTETRQPPGIWQHGNIFGHFLAITENKIRIFWQNGNIIIGRMKNVLKEFSLIYNIWIGGGMQCVHTDCVIDEIPP